MRLGRSFLLPVLLLSASLSAAAATPSVGQRAADFTLQALDGSTLSLSQLAAGGRLVVVVLRGYPGYQCPFSQETFQTFVQSAAQFASSGTQVLFVYPGQGGDKSSGSGAAGMVGSQTLPANVHLALDPEYTFTSLYGLRWDATGETAYPSTFLIHADKMVIFSHVGQFHSDFTPVADMLTVIAADNNNPKP
jgi:peroxiredoxin